MTFKPHFFGFTSATDFFTSTIGFAYGHVHTAFVAVFTVITTFIGGFVWDSPEAIYTLWSLMLIDYITGITKAIFKKRFVSFRLWRMPIYFLVTTLMLSLGFWMAKATVVFALLPTILISGFMSVYFTSILENLGELGWLPKPMVKLLKTRFGLYSLIKKCGK